MRRALFGYVVPSHFFNLSFDVRILFYRDGISDGNFKVAKDELESIKQATEDKIGRTIPISESDSHQMKYSSIVEVVFNIRVSVIAFVICQSQQQGFKMVPSAESRDHRGKPITNVGSGTLLQCGPNSFYLIAQGGLKGTSKPVKHIVFLNENESPSQGRSGLTIENLMNLVYQLCWNYPTATKAVRELPPIKYAKRLGNQVLSSMNCLEAGCHWFGKNIRLVCPSDDTGTADERRPYLEWVRVYLC
jgi:hypothetical protein